MRFYGIEVYSEARFYKLFSLIVEKTKQKKKQNKKKKKQKTKKKKTKKKTKKKKKKTTTENYISLNNEIRHHLFIA